MGYKYKLVTFQFEIPVKISDDVSTSDKGDQIEAYYKARDLFFNYGLNEAQTMVSDITEEEFNHRQEVDQKLHNFK